MSSLNRLNHIEMCMNSNRFTIKKVFYRLTIVCLALVNDIWFKNYRHQHIELGPSMKTRFSGGNNYSDHKRLAIEI